MASSSKEKGSLSSVVSSLVRAQHGASTATVPADDLDAYVADMLLKEAKEREARWGKEGVSVYFSDEDQEGPVHRTNKRFLNAMIKNVDDHNQALLKQEKDRERKEQPSNPRGSANRLFALAKSGMTNKPVASTSNRTSTLRHEHEAISAKEEADRKGKSRSRDSDDSGTEAKRYRRSSHKHRSKRISDEEEDGHRRSSRRSDERRSSRRSASPEQRSSRRPEYSEDSDIDSTERRRKSKRSSRHDASDEERRSSRSRRRKEEALQKGKEGRYESEEVDSRRGSKSHRSRYRDEDEQHSPRRSKHSSRYAVSPKRSRSPVAAPLPVPRVLPPSRSPTPPSRDVHAPDFLPSTTTGVPSKMDKYFTSTYDPRLDVSVSDLTNESGYIAEGNFDEWSRMIEILKVRKEEKGFREREREEQKLIEREKKRDEKKRKKKKVESDEETEGIKIRKTANMDYVGATGAALLSIGGYAKTKKQTEWGAGPDLSF